MLNIPLKNNPRQEIGTWIKTPVLKLYKKMTGNISCRDKEKPLKTFWGYDLDANMLK